VKSEIKQIKAIFFEDVFSL